MTSVLDGRPLTRRSLMQGAAGLSLAALLAACGEDDGGGAASASSGPALRLSVPIAGGAGSVWRPAIEKFDLSAEAPAVKWVGGDPGQVQTHLISGVVDVSVFGAVTAAQANAKGADILIAGPALNNHGRWLVRDDSPYRTPKDLRGKKVASQPSNSDTFTQAAIVAALQGDDLKNDYELLFGAPAANVALFERGDVDAIIAIEPSATKLVAGGAREIARVGDLYKEATGSDQPLLLNGRAVRAAEYNRRKADYDRVIASYTAVNERIQQDPTVLRQFATQMGFKASETKAIELLPERLKEVYPTQFGAAERKNLDDQIAEAVKLGLLPAAPKASLYTEV